MAAIKSFNRDHLLFRAKLAEETRRYEDLVEDIKTLAQMDQEFNAKERSWLAVAYKSLLNPRRHSWAILSTIERKKWKEDATDELDLVIGYRHKVEEEIESICLDATALLDNHLIPRAKTPDAQAYYIKMKGDYYRYQAEFMSGDRRTDAISKSAVAYEMAACISGELEPLNPSRLAVALNFAVFCYTILEDPERAYHLAREAHDSAILEPSEGICEQSAEILMMLNENLMAWEIEDLSEESTD